MAAATGAGCEDGGRGRAGAVLVCGGRKNGRELGVQRGAVGGVVAAGEDGDARTVLQCRGQGAVRGRGGAVVRL